MAASTTETPAAVGSTRNSRQPIRTASGITSRRIAEKAAVVLLTIFLNPASARIMPIRIMVSGVLQLPRLLMLRLMTPGSGTCVIMRTSPIPTAMMQGWVTTFFNTSFLPGDSVK